ncbi:transglycosylase [Lactiplantibacillus sp. DA1]|uniref:aggregation-promoting factor C-terminal-like domain-containing protein n=1 Tax=Lactiplantibacillus sp. DA1 TaxID=3079857 RepID=UPI00292A6030|nr:transglycosylase [Lactiplantibacillus sp. DA1]MDV0430428.1 transglycosylase [Lactiplantibacillus sp. DA1]
MQKFKLKTILLFALASCIFGITANITTSFVPSITVTAQAAKKPSQAQQITKVNAKLSKANRAAKNWIAYRESGYSYTARNGRCYGRYQLLRSYLHGNLSPLNQERRANTYVAARYGSWVNAKRFWQHHHWY